MWSACAIAMLSSIATAVIPALCIIFVALFLRTVPSRRCCGVRGDGRRCDRAGLFCRDRPTLCRTCKLLKAEHVRAYKRAQSEGGVENLRLELALRKEVVSRYFEGKFDFGHGHQVNIIEDILTAVAEARSRPPPVWESLPW